MLRRQQINNAAIYLRLSRDDGGDAESNSIGNQRAILKRYADEHGFNVFDEYVDDGWSGTDFERPSLKRMLGDINEGKVGIVMCKDLSRFGRHNAMVSYYTEMFFPENDIRFIAVNDGIDSEFGENEIMPFKSIINEYYARDISKKIRSAYKAQAHKGAYIARVAPYGYMKNPENTYQLIPNPETVGTLCRIFSMAASGISAHAIAKTLRQEQIVTPSVYNKRTYDLGFRELYTSDCDWCPSTVRAIVKNEVYLGHMLSQKRATKSFKSKKMIVRPEEEWIRVENTHIPLVDENTFELANKALTTKRREPNKHGFVNIFVGIIKCADCGTSLTCLHPTKNKPTFGYQCNRYRHHAKRYCTNHYIKHDNIYNIVLTKIQQKVQLVNKHRGDLAKYAEKLAAKNSDNDQSQIQAKLVNHQKRQQQLNMLFQKLFEQNAMGMLSDEQFISLSENYSNEQQTVKNKIVDLQAKLSQQDDGASDTMQFFKLVSKYTEITELTTEIVIDLIDKVVVHAPSNRGKGENRKQKVEVHFRFIKEQSWGQNENAEAEGG
jgi:DNA invertase Pin-like site-specific DNA recombinase